MKQLAALAAGLCLLAFATPTVADEQDGAKSNYMVPTQISVNGNPSAAWTDFPELWSLEHLRTRESGWNSTAGEKTCISTSSGGEPDGFVKRGNHV